MNLLDFQNDYRILVRWYQACVVPLPGPSLGKAVQSALVKPPPSISNTELSTASAASSFIHEGQLKAA